MLETVNILKGSTFVTSDRHGDIEGTPTSPHGLFALDTRFLSLWKLTLGDTALSVLSTDEQAYFSAQFFLAPSTGTTYVDSPMSVLRRRWVENGMIEQIAVVNHTPEERDVHLHLDFAADFADLFEVKDALQKKGSLYSSVDGDKVVLGYVREEFRRETHIQVQAEGAQISAEAIDFDIKLAPGGTWLGEFRVEPKAIGMPESSMNMASLEQLQQRAKTFRDEAPRVTCDWRPLERAYEKSIEDLDALRLDLGTVGGGMIPAAGLP
ncbi:MAG TPA: glycogen debranching N-terminal domain-containing protein, partial [Dehalococcoidia bacterium]